MKTDFEILSHPYKESVIALQVLWALSAAAILVSLWMVGDGSEPGAIYLRAGCILYLSLSITTNNEVARSIRVAMGCVLLILAVAAITVSASNIVLYIAAGFSIVHIILSILTYKGGDMVPISGLRGLAFMSTAAFASMIAVSASVLADNGKINVSRGIVFATVGASTLALANGVPRKEKDQVVGAFAVLAPASAAMYCLGSLTEMEPWILAGGAAVAGLIAAIICVTVVDTWRNSVIHMCKFVVSSKTMALFLLITFTFGNIACINGIANATEGLWCATGSHLNIASNSSVLSYLPIEVASIATVEHGGRTTLCIDPASDDRSLKAVEEVVPLLLMGLAKGALAVILLLELHSDHAETSAWATAAVLGISAVIMLSIEGRGRCFNADTSECDVHRSPGFLSGLAICGASSLVCICRTIYSGYWVPYQVSLKVAALALALGERPPETPGCRSRVSSMLKTSLSRKDVGMAIATTALLVCLISTSNASVTALNLPTASTSNISLASYDQSLTAVINRIFPLANTSVARCSTNKTICTTGIPRTPSLVYASRIQNRAGSLTDYWRTTSYLVAASIFVLSFIAVETLPNSPSVGIALMAALLLIAGRVHFGCLISSLNARLFSQGVQLYATVDLNVYIMGTISIVIGLAWGGAVVGPRPESKQVSERRQTTETLITLEIGEYVAQSYSEAFTVLEQANLVLPFVSAGLITSYAKEGERLYAKNSSWNVWGQSKLCEGSYLMSITVSDMMEVAQACADQKGKISLVMKTMTPRAMVKARVEAKASDETTEDSEEGS